MIKNIVIFGNGNHCQIVKQEILKHSNYRILAVYDFIEGRIKLADAYKKSKISWQSNFYGITAAGDNRQREVLVNKVNKSFKNIKWIKIVSKNSVVEKDVKIGEGTLVVSGSVINTNASIGEHCIVNTSSSIDHDTKIGKFSNIAPGVHIAGNVNVGNSVFIGMGTCIQEKININSNVSIGAQSFVNKNCEKNSQYFGLPAKKKK